MRLTVKQNEIQPIGLNKQKKIIIDRLYNKDNKTDLNPQAIPLVNHKHRVLDKGNDKQVAYAFQGVTRRQQIQQLNSKAELQPVYKQWPAKQNNLLANNESSNETYKNNESMLLTCSKGQQENYTCQYGKQLHQKFGLILRKSQDLTQIFENLKTNYKPVSRPQIHRRIERSLFAELYEIQSRMSKSNDVVETANFNYLKSNNMIKSTENQQMLNKKSKGIQNQQQITLMTFNFNKENQNNRQNKSQLDDINESRNLRKNQNYWSRDGQVNKQLQFPKYDYPTRIQVNRRSKTEASLLLRPKQNNYLFHHIYLTRAQQSIRNPGPSNRYLRPAPRVNTQRSSQEAHRPVGCIRRQNSHQDLFCLQNLHGQSLGTRRQQVSQSSERLRQIRQQLHEIYNNHRQTTNNVYSSKNINNRSQCSLPKNQMIVNTKVMDKSMNNSRKCLETQYGIGKINRGRNEGGNQNYRLLIQRPKNKSKV